MKLIATLALSVALCGIASAAPISTDSQDNSPLAVDIMGAQDTATHDNGGNGHTTLEDCLPPPVGEAIPEPASLALLGIGLGLAALRRKM